MQDAFPAQYNPYSSIWSANSVSSTNEHSPIPLTFEAALSELGTKCSVLTDLLRPLLLCGTALCLRRTTREHVDHFVGVDRGGG